MIEPEVFKGFAGGLEEILRKEEGSLNRDPLAEQRRAGLHKLAPGTRPPRDGYSRTSATRGDSSE